MGGGRGSNSIRCVLFASADSVVTCPLPLFVRLTTPFASVRGQHLVLRAHGGGAAAATGHARVMVVVPSTLLPYSPGAGSNEGLPCQVRRRIEQLLPLTVQYRQHDSSVKLLSLSTQISHAVLELYTISTFS